MCAHTYTHTHIYTNTHTHTHTHTLNHFLLQNTHQLRSSEEVCVLPSTVRLQVPGMRHACQPTSSGACDAPYVHTCTIVCQYLFVCLFVCLVVCLLILLIAYLIIDIRCIFHRQVCFLSAMTVYEKTRWGYIKSTIARSLAAELKQKAKVLR